MYHVRVKTDEGTEIISQSEINNFIKYDENESTENDLILDMVKAARELLEKYLNISMKQKTYVLEFDGWSVDANLVDVPFGPVVSIASVKQVDNEGTETPLTSATDYVSRGEQFKTIFLPYVVSDYRYIVEYVAGYGPGTETLPEALKQAVMDLVKFWYQREEQDMSIPATIKSKVAPYSQTTRI